jgi:hypothetical protein
MPASDPSDLTSLLTDWRAGDEAAGRKLMEAMYRELKRLAAVNLRREFGAVTLQPTALVNELCSACFPVRRSVARAGYISCISRPARCGAHTNTSSLQCYDVSLDGGTLAPGNYQIAISAFENMSFAENLGTGTLADGFTGLGNLAGGEDLHYAFDVVLGSASPVPEPSVGWLLGGAVLAVVGIRRVWMRRVHVRDAAPRVSKGTPCSPALQNTPGSF